MTSATTNIIDHLPCHACEYDLHTLASNANCPECGAAIGESLRRSTVSDVWTNRFIAYMVGVVGVLVAGNLMQANDDLSGLGAFLLIWILAAPLSLLFAIFCGVSRKPSWSLFWIGLMMTASAAAGLNFAYLMSVS